jgi:ferredoxin
MIVGQRKPLGEIRETIAGCRNVLILGCGTCTSVCLTGGDKEALALAHALTVENTDSESMISFEVKTIERQCEKDWVASFLEISQETDAILSLACGAGVQTLASVIKRIPVLPALNTTFIGAQDDPGIWTEKCSGCGDCMLAFTGGICPVSRCAKRLFNGPCGGSSKGKCEITPLVGRDVECAWHSIIERFQELGTLDNYHVLRMPKDWQSAAGSVPRILKRNEHTPYRNMEIVEDDSII